MAEEFINCRNCGRAVPKTMYCIYCGSGLQGGELLRPEAQEQPTEAIIPDFKWEPLRQTPVDLKVESSFPLIRTEPELDKGFLDQIEELRKHWAWQLKLVDMITEIGIAEEVFTKIYNEYSTEIERLGNILEERRAASSEEYARKKAELSEMETAHEELSVRVAVGQLPSRALQRRTPISKERMDGLTRDIKRLETTLSKLDDVMGDIYPEDKRNLETSARKSLRSLDGLVVEAQIDQPFSVGRPGVSRLCHPGRHLLGVHPIEAPVEDGLAAVRGEPLDLTVAYPDRVQIIVLHERYLRARGRKCQRGLDTVFSQ